MTPKTLFIIIIRIIGLLLLLDLLRVIPQLLKNILFLLSLGDTTVIFIGAFFSILMSSVYAAVLIYSLFKADKLVDKLSLAKKIDEERIELNIHSSTVIKIAVVFIGGTTILNYFAPVLLNLLDFVAKQSNQSFTNFETGTRSFDKMVLVHDVIMLLIGYFLITNCNSVSNWISKAVRKTK